MKKVLVITYYWPPSGGGGVQRWLKFTKYLPDFGWEPIVYTPLNQNAPNLDKDLLNDVPKSLRIIRRPIWEPYNLYKRFTGKKKNENLGASFASGKQSNIFFENTSNWIRSNFFIPDARKLWIKPSVSFLRKLLKTEQIKVVVTTGPPHSMHLIGLQLKIITGIKWLADFRDPWTDIDYYDQLKLTKWADRKHHLLERKVLLNADAISCVSQSNKEKLSKTENTNIRVITNGFDETDIKSSDDSIDRKFTLVHIGTFMANRNPDVLWEVLSELIDEKRGFIKDFELQLIGKTDTLILEALNKWHLTQLVKTRPPISHKKATQLQKSAQVLLLAVNNTGDSKGMVTGKLFEYLAAKRPILAIGPEDGDLAKILKETKAGVISDFQNKNDLKKNLLSFYQDYKKGALYVNPINIEKYSRKNLTGEMADFLNTLAQ